jgi:single-stranded DNA-binding protein
MTQFRISFSGAIRKPIAKELQGKQMLAFQLMRKNYNKDAAADATYTWVNVSVFDCRPSQIEQCLEGVFVSGIGEFSMRSYTDKSGANRQSADVRCSGRDIDTAYVEHGQQRAEAPVAKPVRRDAVSPSSTEVNDEPPF